MSINLNEWKLLEPSSKGFGVKSRAIEIFLKENNENAFTEKEIFEAIKEHFKDCKDEKRGHSNLSTILNGLCKRGKIEHKRPYWKIKESEEGQ